MSVDTPHDSDALGKPLLLYRSLQTCSVRCFPELGGAHHGCISSNFGSHLAQGDRAFLRNYASSAHSLRASFSSGSRFPLCLGSWLSSEGGCVQGCV